VYRYSPSLCRIYYSALYLPGVRSLAALYTKKSHRSVYKIATQSFPADVIIGTSYGFDALILEDRKRLQSEGKTVPLFVNIVVDPRTFFMTNVVDDADVNCVFDDVIAQRCKKAHPRAVVESVGWFVRPEFNRSIEKKEMRRALGLDENKLTLLFAAGSEGEVKSAQLIPQLLSLGEPIQIVLACGSNEQLRQSFHPLVEQYASHASIKFVTLPFTKEVYKYVRAADLLVGKAGPNTIFEAAACGTPFFATTHIAGQEDGNLDIIREHKIGYVEENLDSARRLLSQIIAHPEMLREFDEPMKKLAAYNDTSIDRLLDLINKLKRS
jgi:UDP-N-acetylglucosamine:LPS N-acetylglucosamine transferase